LNFWRRGAIRAAVVFCTATGGCGMQSSDWWYFSLLQGIFKVQPNSKGAFL